MVVADKIDLVKEILVSLVISLRDAEGNKRKRARFQRLEPSRFYTTEMKGSHHKTVNISSMRLPRVVIPKG